MSAIADSTDGPIEVVNVLFALFPNYNTLDVAGPLEVLNRSLHNPKDACMSFFSLAAQLACWRSSYLPTEHLLTFSRSFKGLQVSVRRSSCRHD